MGQLIGALIAAFLLTSLYKKLAKKFLEEPKLTLVAVALAAITATVIGAFGMANGGSPQWGASASVYISAHIIYLAIVMTKMSFANKKAEKAAAEITDK